MTSHTQIKLTGKDKIGCIHEIIIEDCSDNPDWFIIKTRIPPEIEYSIISLPKTFILSLTSTMEKFY